MANSKTKSKKAGGAGRSKKGTKLVRAIVTADLEAKSDRFAGGDLSRREEKAARVQAAREGRSSSGDLPPNTDEVGD